MPQISIPATPNPKSTNFDPESYSPKRGRPILFQVVAPKTNAPIYPVLLALHVNPESLEETAAKNQVVVPTRGGFVEFRWPDELGTLSASNTTGAFYSPGAGLTAGNDAAQNTGRYQGRQGTIAWERQEDLLDLFHNNGMVFDGEGRPAIRGRVMMIYDRGIYTGFFTTFEVDEDDSHAYSFQLSWEFTIEKTLYRFVTTSLQPPTQTPPSPLSPQTTAADLGSPNAAGINV